MFSESQRTDFFAWLSVSYLGDFVTHMIIVSYLGDFVSHVIIVSYLGDFVSNMIIVQPITFQSNAF